MPQIIKRNGSRTEFDRNKLVASMKLALRKRPVMAESVEAAINRIEERLLSLGERSCLQSIGEQVMRELRKLDKVGYIRYASVYRNFEDVMNFPK